MFLAYSFLGLPYDTLRLRAFSITIERVYKGRLFTRNASRVETVRVTLLSNAAAGLAYWSGFTLADFRKSHLSPLTSTSEREDTEPIHPTR